MDIFVLPTLCEEGFGLAAVEAMLLKVPVIVSDIPGLNTVVTKETGRLFIPGDERDLADQILGILADEEERRLMIDRAYERAMNNYSMKRVGSEMRRLYEEVLSVGA